MSDQNLSSFIWSVADLLRGDYKQSEYGNVILPFTVLRCLEFDILTAEAQRSIDLLKERRSALISAAVAGQIDVRGEVTK